MALKNGVVEQNLANEPAVSVFIYASPKIQLMTTAFLSHLPPHPLRTIPCLKTPKAEGSKHQKVIVRRHKPTIEKPTKSTRIITAMPAGRRHASSRPYPAQPDGIPSSWLAPTQSFYASAAFCACFSFMRRRTLAAIMMACCK